MNASQDRKRPQKTATTTPVKSSATTRTSSKAAAAGPAKDAVTDSAKLEPTKAKPHPLPSARLRVATSSPFAKKGEGKTPFTVIYNGGGIPCRINHGTARCYLQWNKPPTELAYDPLLLHCAEGIRETTHPQNFVARTAFQELLAAEGAREKTLPIVSRIIQPLRMALLSTDKEVFKAGLDAIRSLSEATGEALNEHLGVLVIQINKKAYDKTLKDAVYMTLATMEECGGPESFAIIKSKIPAYNSVCI